MKTTASITTTVALLVFLACGAAPGSAQTGAPRGAKSLFYGSSGATIQPNAPAPGVALPSTPPASGLVRGYPSSPAMSSAAMAPPSEYMGVTYWVELIDQNGQTQRVTAQQVFRSGDRVRLHVTTNRDGYLTLVNVGSTGRTSVLFPYPGSPGNFVRAMSEVTIPATYLRFDANPGEEILVLTLMPQGNIGGGPMTTQPASPASGMPPTVASAPPYGAPSAGMPPSSMGGLPAGFPSDTSSPSAFPGLAGSPPSLPMPPGTPPSGPMSAGAPPSAPMPTGPPPAVPTGPTPAGVPGADPTDELMKAVDALNRESPMPSRPPVPQVGQAGGSPMLQPQPNMQPGQGQPGPSGFDMSKIGDMLSMAQSMARSVASTPATGSKDLMVETEGGGAQPASYAVAPMSAVRDSGGSIAVQIRLRHL